MMTYATEGPGSLDAILAELDAAWPDEADAGAGQTAGGGSGVPVRSL